MAGACGLLLLVFVVVSVVVVSASKSLDLCNVRSAERLDGPQRGIVEWNWIPPYPECVWRSDGHERREAVVFDPVTGSIAVLLALIAAASFGWWLVLTVREAEQIAAERSSE